MAVESKTGGFLSAAQRETYDRDGYLVIDDPCPGELLNGVLSEMEPLLADDFDPGPMWQKDGVKFFRNPGRDDRFHWHRIMNAWRWCANVRALALAPRVLGIAGELFGRKPLPFQTLNFPVGTQQPAHYDSMAFNTDPPGYMCGVWVALEDMDMDNGPLLYYPGSHRLPRPGWDTIDEEMGYSVAEADYPSAKEYMDAREQQCVAYIDRVIEKHGLKPAYGTIRKGQALLWAPNLLHGGAPQADKSRTRQSQVTHYYFDVEGARHHTPLRAEPDHIYCDYPQWIREPVPYDTTEAIHDAIRACIPEGSTVAIATDGYEGLLDLEGRTAWHFPQAEDGTELTHRDIGDDAVERLEQLRARGAEYAVFPRARHLWLRDVVPQLQHHLETRYRAVLRDGSICVVYALV